MTTQAKNDSLGKRYLFKLVSNMATIPLFFVLEAVLPRALGPAAYGNYNFVTTLFQNFTNFLDMGTSTCLFTSLSKHPGDFSLVAFYARTALAMLLLCLLAGLLMLLPGAGEWLMPGVPLWMALPAALWAYITWAGRVTRGMNDALGFTNCSELVRIGVNVFSALLLLGLYFGGILTLPVLFGHQYFTLGLMAAGFALCLQGFWNGRPSPPTADATPETRTNQTNPWFLTRAQQTGHARDFWRYSGPLFVTALCSALALSGERWMLQFFNGSTQQGFFSLSQKVGIACFMFVSAMTPLITRELAVAHGKGDPREMARLLDRFAPMLYALAAWLSCFTLAEAPAVVRLFGGGQFAEALLPVQIMALYPIHQGYGQVAGAVFYAAGETRLLRNITLFSLALGLICAWVLLAPAPGSVNSFAAGLPLAGLGLGAPGLAWKMVGVQFITVNILLLTCRKIAPFRYGRNLIHQLLCPATLLALALVARYGTEAAGLGQTQDILRFLISGCVYCLLCLLLALVCPFLFGLKRGEPASQARWVLQYSKEVLRFLRHT